MRKAVSSATVANYLRQKIETAEWQADDKLPSEREISERLQTTRVTTREALKLLESEGRIYRSNRRGWFVTPSRIQYDPSRAMYFMDYVADQGFQPFSQQTLKQRITADEELAERMGIDVGEPLLELHRLRGSNGRPVYFERIYLREKLLPGIADKSLEQSVSRIIHNEYQSGYGQVDLDIIVGSLDEFEASQLQAPAGYACIEIQRKSFDPNGDVLEYDIEYWRHDSLKLKVSLGKNN